MKIKKEAKKKNLCTKCKSELKLINLGNYDPFSFNIFSITPTVFYCINKECEHFGVLTLATLSESDE